MYLHSHIQKIKHNLCQFFKNTKFQTYTTRCMFLSSFSRSNTISFIKVSILTYFINKHIRLKDYMLISQFHLSKLKNKHYQNLQKINKIENSSKIQKLSPKHIKTILFRIRINKLMKLLKSSFCMKIKRFLI